MKKLVLTIQIAEARAQRLENQLSISRSATALTYSSVSRDSDHRDDTDNHPVLTFLFSAPQQLTPMQLTALFAACEMFKAIILDLIYIESEQNEDAETPVKAAQRRLTTVIEHTLPVRLIIDNTGEE